LGGGHEIAYASFVGLARQRAGSGSATSGIGVVNLDAHFDLRQAAHPNSGTSMLGIANFCQDNGLPFRCCCLGIAEPSNTAALFDRARELRVDWRTDEQMTLQHLSEILATLRAFAATVDELYLTICLDVLPASVAPGVSAPAARGVSLEVIESLVAEVKSTGKLTAADIAELNPEFDVDNRTAKVAARLIYRIAA
jgi:formiminoglutamase